MSFKRCAFVCVALACFAAGCAHQDPGQLKAATEEITKLKAELLRTTNQLHAERAQVDDSETKMFAVETSKRDAQARVAELTAENKRLMRSAKAQLEKPPG